MQADPHIQAPKNSQNYNRYSYVLNNPLSYTDPSGYFFKSLFKKLNKALGKFAPLAALALGLWLPGSSAIWGSLANSLTSATVTGFLAGGIATGSLKGALVGAFSGAAFYKIGSHFAAKSSDNLLAAKHGIGARTFDFGGLSLSQGQIAQQIAAHAFVGGVAADLSGGKFGHGFFSAGVTKGIGGQFLPGGSNLSAQQVVEGTFVSAVIGGTASAITGGKFANGAQTGAFQYLFNQARRELERWSYENQLKKGLLRFGIDGYSSLKSSEMRAMDRMYSPKDAFVFAVHGNPNGIYLNGIPQMARGASSLEDIVNTLTEAGYDGTKPLFMLSCELASNGMGQELSNYYNQTVIGASSGLIWIGGSSSRGYSYTLVNDNAYIREWKPNE